MNIAKVKVNITLEQAMKAQRYVDVQLYSALVGVCVQLHAAAALPQGKTRYPLLRRLGGP